MAKVVINFLNRIEGYLKVELEVENKIVTDAKCQAINYRGIEEILTGRDLRDGIYFTSRISGISSFSHGIAAVKAFNAAFSLMDSKNARNLKNIQLGACFINSHISHFYQRALFDYLKGNGKPPFGELKKGDYRFSLQQEKQLMANYFEAMDVVRTSMDIIAIFGGKYPHTASLVPGGISEHIDAQKIILLKTQLNRINKFIINKYIPDVRLLNQVYNDGSAMGIGNKQFLSFGCFSLDNDFKDQGLKLFAQGVYKNNSTMESISDDIREDIQYSFYKGQGASGDVFSTHKISNNKVNAYTWVKAPRYQDEAFEVGPLARMIITNPKISNGGRFTDLGKGIFSVNGRHLARAEECLLIAENMGQWLDKLNPDKVISVPYQSISAGQGTGLTESPQGALGHWLKTNGKNITGYNIIDPSTWNLSPIDEKGNHGPIEKALIGTEFRDLSQPIEISRIIQSFDPNITAAVH